MSDTATAATSATVLIAEDEPDLRQLYEIWLGDRWTLRLAADGKEAIDAFDGNVSIALLDRRLPRADGEVVARHIRDRSSCPIAMVSAGVPSTNILSLPLDAYLCKPVARDELDRLVEQLYALRDLDERVREYFALTAKLATLLSEASIVELESDEEFRRACDRIDELSDYEEVLDAMEELNPAHEALLRQFTR